MFNRLVEYLRQSRSEFAKVSWPNRSEAIRLTVAVLVFTAVFSAVIGGLDFVFSQVLQKVILKG